MLVVSLIGVVGCSKQETPKKSENSHTNIQKNQSKKEESKQNSTSHINSNKQNTIQTQTSSTTVSPYQLFPSTYNKISAENQSLVIDYPKVTDMSNETLQNSINEIIKNGYINTLNENDGIQFYGNIQYFIKTQTPSLLSIVYTGEVSPKDAAHPTDLFYTTNIDMKSGKELKLTDFTTVDSHLIDLIKNAQYVAPEGQEINQELQNAVLDYIKNTDNDTLLSMLQENGTNSYLTKNAVVISIEVPHAIGDHAEFTIDLQNFPNAQKFVN